MCGLGHKRKQMSKIFYSNRNPQWILQPFFIPLQLYLTIALQEWQWHDHGNKIIINQLSNFNLILALKFFKTISSFTCKVDFFCNPG